MEYTRGLGVNMDGFKVDLKKLEDLIRYGAKRKSEFNEDLEDKFYELRDRYISISDFFPDYCDQHENPIFFWNGPEGLLVDFINEQEHLNSMFFRFEDNCIYIEPIFPKDEADKKNILSVEDINRIFREYVGKVVVPVSGSGDQGLEIKWHDIYY